MASSGFVQFLEQAKTSGGVPVKSHLGGVVTTLVLQHPQHPLEVYESVSAELKRVEEHKANIEEAIDALIDELDEKDLRKLKPDLQGENSEFVSKAAAFFGFVKPENEDGSDAQDPPADPAPLGYVPDLLADDSLFRKAGFGFGEKEAFVLYNSLKKFVQAKNAPFAKFWGKIRGTARDYYVIETDVEIENPEEITESHEPRKEGVNKKQYFVTNDRSFDLLTIAMDSAGWVDLPIVLPRHIIESRRVSHTFTGFLDAPVHSSPVFHGKEKHYLKAQIVRIDYATDIAPDHLWKVKRDDEEDPNPQEIEKIEGEDLKEPAFSAFQNLQRLVHLSPGILKEGRVKRKEIEDEDADKKALLEKEAVKEDPYEFRLKPLAQDKYADLNSCWSIRIHGDFQKRLHAYKPKQVETAFISLRSLVWPGLVHILSPDLTLKTLYIGSGHKYSPNSYFPQFAYLLHTEPEEKAEHSEPNGEREEIAIGGMLDTDGDGVQGGVGVVDDDQGDN